jgi:hypothetical protein
MRPLTRPATGSVRPLWVYYVNRERPLGRRPQDLTPVPGHKQDLTPVPGHKQDLSQVSGHQRDLTPVP